MTEERDDPAGPRAGPGTVSSTVARRGVPLLAGIAAAVLVFDVLTKIAAVATLEQRPPLELLGGAVYLVLLRNPGAAWSMATGYTWVLTIVAIVVVGVIIRIARRLASTGWAIGLGLVLGGALGNLIDRFFRSPGPLRGHVVDMVSLFAPDGSVWPVFNVADSSIVCGGILLVVMAVRGIEIDGSRAPGKDSPDESSDETAEDAGRG